jgi:hypothetical protein
MRRQLGPGEGARRRLDGRLVLGKREVHDPERSLPAPAV